MVQENVAEVLGEIRNTWHDHDTVLKGIVAGYDAGALTEAEALNLVLPFVKGIEAAQATADAMLTLQKQQEKPNA